MSKILLILFEEETLEMIHARFKRTPYEAGFLWGQQLFHHGFYIHEHLQIGMEEERKAFASLCIPIYETYAPDILSEIKGIADGQRMPWEDLCTFLFGMYCFDLNYHCTCFSCFNTEHTLLGRNSDFLITMEQQYMNCIYQYKHSIPFQANTTAFVQMEDGMNAYGLAVGFTFVYTNQRKPGLNGGMLVRLLLERCQTTKEACDLLKQIPIASSQTFTIADSHKDIVVVECTPHHMELVRPTKENPHVIATNHYQSMSLAKEHSSDMDDWRSQERYQNVQSALRRHSSTDSLTLARDILSGRYGFMCQYDRKTGADTVWSVIYDTQTKKIYRVEGNPSRKQFKEDQRWNKIMETI